MPSRIGSALERRELREEFDELSEHFVEFTRFQEYRDDVVVILEMIVQAMDECLEDLREAERRFNFAGVVGNIPHPIADFDDEWLRQHCRFVGWKIRELMRILHVPPIIRVPGS
eukprot:jgi/Pico_ML_1/50617/g1799.t1